MAIELSKETRPVENNCGDSCSFERSRQEGLRRLVGGEQLLSPQFLQPRQAAAAVQVAIEIVGRKEVFVEKLLMVGRVFFHREPLPQMFFVGEILIRHIGRIAAVGDFADGIDTVIGNLG